MLNITERGTALFSLPDTYFYSIFEKMYINYDLESRLNHIYQASSNKVKKKS